VRDSHCLVVGATRQRRLWPLARRRRSRAAASCRVGDGARTHGAGRGRGTGSIRRACGVHTTVCKARKAEKTARESGPSEQQRPPKPSVKCSPSDRVDRDWHENANAPGARERERHADSRGPVCAGIAAPEEDIVPPQPAGPQYRQTPPPRPGRPLPSSTHDSIYAAHRPRRTTPR